MPPTLRGGYDIFRTPSGAPGRPGKHPQMTSERPAMVPLGPGEIMTGWASCDDIEVLYDDEVRADLGAITAPAMRRVEAGLRAALGMPDQSAPRTDPSRPSARTSALA